MVSLTDKPIDIAPLVAGCQRPEAGAVVLFLGITREFTDGRQTAQLHYEAYRVMAEREMRRLEARAFEQWPLASCCIVHRLGPVPLSEASVAIVVGAPHRDEAFAAGRWLIDELKRDVPIWKREHYTDGATEWRQPDAPSEAP